ncbi:MAG TPA: T9SS type A sorting domain-containing protein [Bacteroidales bacterium]|nr:T9SS type A sorting domain-containing protein [Bacteroidales bacterium]
MKRKPTLLAIGAAFAIMASLYLLNSKPQDPREQYEEYLLAQFAALPDDLDTEASGENRPDRPDLAAIQNYFSILDPALGRVPVERLKPAWEYSKTRRQSSMRSANSLTWSTEGSNMGGRTRAIMYDPNDASGNKVWAGSVTGGLWYNNDITDDLSPWMPVDGMLANLSISCLVSDPQNPQVFFAGTGESETARVIYRESSGVGMGILKSNDGGASWAIIPSTEEFKYVTDIQIRVESGISVIYAGVASGYYKGTVHQSGPANGLFRSVDGGQNWTQVLPDMPGLDEPYAVSDIKIQSDGRIYVGSMETPELEGGGTIFYSDMGTAGSWTMYENVKTLIENSTTENIPGRVILAMAPSDPAVVYALFSVGFDDGFVFYKGRYIFRTSDHGQTWQQINLPDYDYATLSWHALTAAVDPVDPDHLYVGGLDVWSSANGGSSWTHQTDWSLMYWGGGSDYVHADQHVQVYKDGSTDEMLFGSDGGVFYTSNASSANPAFEEKNRNYSTLQFYTCAISPVAGDNRYIGGLQDNGTLYFQGDPLDINDMIDGGDGAYCFWDKDEPNIFITSVYYNRYSVFLNGYPYQDAGEYSGTFICPADYDYKTNRLYANACSFFGYRADQLLRSSNIPNNPYNTYIYLGTGESTPFTFVRYSDYSPEGASTLYVGGQTGRLFRVENAQAVPSVTEITGTDFPAGSISSIAIGGSEDTLLVTFSNYGVPSVWQTYDGGDTWTDVEANLPDMPVRYGLYHPEDARQVMLATELGIWTCNHLHLEDPEWTPDNNGMADVRIDFLQVREADNTVLAATHGLGLYTTTWISDPWVSVPENDFLSGTNIWPNPARDNINISLEDIGSSSLQLHISDMQGRRVIEHQLDGAQKTHVVDLNNIASGTYVLRISSGGKTFSRKIIKE